MNAYQTQIKAIEECKLILSQGHSDLALGFLYKTFSTEGTNILLLLNRLERLRDKVIRGIIKYTDYDIEQNNINLSIILLIKKIELSIQNGDLESDSVIESTRAFDNLQIGIIKKRRFKNYELREYLFVQALKSCFLFVLLDQYNHILVTTDEQDYLLWGWSVSDPARKEKATLKSQDEEPRAASLVVSSFVINGINGPIEIPGLNLQSEKLVRGTINSLNLRYGHITKTFGVFGTAKKRIASIENSVKVDSIPVNCRHIAAGIMYLTRIMLSNIQYDNNISSGILSGFKNGLSKQILSALNYLMDLDEWAVFSQDPSRGKFAQLDSGTIPIILEMLNLIPSINWLASLCDEPIAQPENFVRWRERTISNGVTLLNRLKISYKHEELFLWDYSFDKSRKLSYEQLTTQAHSIVEKPIRLYYTARNLYGLRNFLFEPKFKNTFQFLLYRLKEIYIQRNYSLPTFYPSTDEDNFDFTNTAFFLNALIPDDGQEIPHEFEELFEAGINYLLTAFLNKDAEKSLTSVFDLRVDGVSMILRLLLHSQNYAKYISNYDNIKEFQVLKESAMLIQENIADENYNSIEEKLEKNGLKWFYPIIYNRIIKPRENWFEYFNLDPKKYIQKK